MADSSITDTLAPACLPILVPVPETAHAAFLHMGSQAHVGPHGLEWLARSCSGSHYTYCVDTLVHPAARPPPSTSSLPSLEMEGTEQTMGFYRSPMEFLSSSHAAPGPLLPPSGCALFLPKATERLLSVVSLSSWEGLVHLPVSPSQSTVGCHVGTCAPHGRGDQVHFRGEECFPTWSWGSGAAAACRLRSAR